MEKTFKAIRHNVKFTDGTEIKNITLATFESIIQHVPNEIASFEKFEIDLPDPLAESIDHSGDARADYIKFDPE